MKRKEYLRPEKISLSHVLSFVFPKNQLYPRTACRLWLIAEQMKNLVLDEGEIKLSSTKLLSRIPLNSNSGMYKRFDSKGRNVNAKKNYSKVVSILTDHEVDVLLEDIEVDFIREIYDTLRKTKFYISKRELSEIRSTIDGNLLKLVLGYTKKEVISLLRKPKTPKKENESHNEYVRRIVLADRARRVKEMKMGQPNPKFIRDESFFNHKSKKFYNKRMKNIRDSNTLSDFNSMTNRLHKSVFKITHPKSKIPMSVLTQNCKTLRDKYIPDPNKPGWDSYCSIRRKGKAGFVKNRNTKANSLSGIGHETQRFSGRIDNNKILHSLIESSKFRKSCVRMNQKSLPIGQSPKMLSCRGNFWKNSPFPKSTKTKLMSTGLSY